jgi:exosortase/archaeosortase family protein
MSRQKRSRTESTDNRASAHQTSPNRAVFWFVTVFVILVVIGSAAELYAVRNEIGVGLQRAIAAAVGWSLRLVSIPAQVHGTSVTIANGSVDVATECIGIRATAIFWAGVIGFPCSWRGRTAGILAGLFGVQLLNMARIAVLGLVNGYQPEWFETLHSVLMQGFLVVFVAPLWILWMVWVIRRDSAWKTPIPAAAAPTAST